MTYDTVIIGGGYAGLSCGALLAKAGRKVCVLEKSATVGGAFQSFRRGGISLDTGFHYVGGVGTGEMMRPLVEALELSDLPWVRLDEDFMEVLTCGETYHLANGFENFGARLKEYFPNETSGIDQLTDIMLYISDHLYEAVAAGPDYENKLMSVPAKEWIDSQIGDPRLRRLLCAQAVTTDLRPDLPLYSFVQSISSFVQHSYRLRGGGGTLVARLCDIIASSGGTVSANREVVSLKDDGNGHIVAARCADGEEISGRTFISTIHPSLSVALMPESPQVRKIYRRRLSHLPNTRGMFTVQLLLKPGSVAYRNSVLSIIGSDPWHADYEASSPVSNLLVNWAVPNNGGAFADNIDLLTPMEYSAVEQWSESRVGARPQAYKDFKARKAQECIELAMRCLPELEGNISSIYTSTPLTYRDYTGTVDGAAYGTRKSAQSIAGGVLSPATPFGNLFLAGQSVILHGMLGVGMTSLMVANILQKQ